MARCRTRGVGAGNEGAIVAGVVSGFEATVFGVFAGSVAAVRARLLERALVRTFGRALPRLTAVPIPVRAASPTGIWVLGVEEVGAALGSIGMVCSVNTVEAVVCVGAWTATLVVCLGAFATIRASTPHAATTDNSHKGEPAPTPACHVGKSFHPAAHGAMSRCAFAQVNRAKRSLSGAIDRAEARAARLFP